MRRDFLPGVPGGVGGWNPIECSVEKQEFVHVHAHLRSPVNQVSCGIRLLVPWNSTIRPLVSEYLFSTL